jgi:hypothetical protein
MPHAEARPKRSTATPKQPVAAANQDHGPARRKKTTAIRQLAEYLGHLPRIRYKRRKESAGTPA